MNYLKAIKYIKYRYNNFIKRAIVWKIARLDQGEQLDVLSDVVGSLVMRHGLRAVFSSHSYNSSVSDRSELALISISVVDLDRDKSDDKSYRDSKLNEALDLKQENLNNVRASLYE